MLLESKTIRYGVSRSWSVCLILTFALFIFTANFSYNAGYAEAASYTLMDAGQRGVVKTEGAKGTLIPTYDESTGKDVLEFDYSIPKGTEIKVWTKNFPASLGPDNVNTAKISVNVPPYTKDYDKVSLKANIKGTKDSQTIDLKLKKGRNFFQKSIDWDIVGNLKEISFVVSHKGGEEPLSGTLHFSIDFSKEAIQEKVEEAVKIPSAFSILDALERAVKKTGSAKGSALPTYDEGIGRDVLEFDYSLPQDSIVSVSARNFPSTLDADAVNTVRAGIRVLDSAQVKQVSVKINIKGTKGEQAIPIKLKSGWNSLQESIDWDTIGSLDEVSFTVIPVGDDDLVKGTFNFALNFIKRIPSKGGVMEADFTPAFTLLDSSAKGMFNIGPAQGIPTVIFDEAVEKDVVKFDYTAPKGTYVGLWTQGYPTELTPKTVDAVRIGVRVPEAEQLDQVSVKVEIKGEDTWQTIQLKIQPGWNYFRESINWNLVGDLKEAVFVISPMGVSPAAVTPMGGRSLEEGEAEAEAKAHRTPQEAEAVSGTLYFDLDFYKLTFFEKYFTFIKVGLVILLSLLFAIIFSLLGGLSRGGRSLRQEVGGKAERLNFISSDGSFLSRIKRDFFYSMVVVLIAAVALWIYSLGMKGPLDVGFNFSFLIIALMGVAIAEVLKSSHTARHLTPTEVFQNILITGLLAAASNRQVLWQAPSAWVNVLMISNLTAALVFLIYHISNAYSLVSHGKHLKPITGGLIAGTPFLFGWLLLVENANLMQTIGSFITQGIFAASPDVLKVLGRLPIIFIFNEAVMNGISVAIKGKPVKKLKVHLYVILVSVGVVIAPVIADLGSTVAVGSMPALDRAIIVILTTMFSFAGLWGVVYLITGIMLDAGKRLAPSEKTVPEHVIKGITKGMAYSGILMAILFAVHILLNATILKNLMSASPLVFGIIAGALIFPFIKTIIETFDGSLPFVSRLKFTYRSKTLYARGAVVGFGFAYMVTQGMFQEVMSERIKFGLIIGLIASGGISFLRDLVYSFRGCGKIQSWRLYFIDSLLGIFVGSAAAFYLDARQVPVVIEKFKLYISAGFDRVDYITYPLVNKWGRVDLGGYTGGAKLIFLESLAGVINWAIAAWLFAINKVFLQAILDKDKTPIKFFFSKAGFAQLVEHMIFVLRWGLWMSPIIFTFLRMMPNPTWYNQDGAIRTLFATFNSVTMSPEAFNAWSLNFFVWILAFDFLRVLIWMDHMGLRVATLVNLSFLGLDKLDERIARFIGPAVTQRYIPEAVKRFCTWGPLLIPFYLPRGRDWDYAWSTSEAMQNGAGGGKIISALKALSLPEQILLFISAILGVTAVSFIIRSLRQRGQKKEIKKYELRNKIYNVVLKENGEIYSEVSHLKKEVFPPEHDVSRRSYDMIDPCGRILFLVDSSQEEKSENRFWPVVGNFPQEKFQASNIEKINNSLHVSNTNNGVRTNIDINLPNDKSTVEIWTVTIENMTDKLREIKLVPYLEWVLNGGLHDRFHTQYARLFPQMEYVSGVNAVLAWQRSTKSMGILAVDETPEGFLTSRMDFIGRARSIWSPRALETLDFLDSQDTASHPTFDPIGSLVVNASLGPMESKKVRIMIGYAKEKGKALALIHKHLAPKTVSVASSSKVKNEPPVIGHGEIPKGTPKPYTEYIDNGRKMIVHTPFTPRPFDHAMSNEVHSVMVNNRGLHTSCNGNSQQNRLTPDWPDTVTKEIPAEAIYLYDEDKKEWFSPTYHPLNDTSAKYESEFGIDGTAVFRMKNKSLSTELTVFVPPDDPTGVYLLTIKNNSNQSRKMRVAPYFQMVLEFQPERSGPLQKKYDKNLNALFFRNPRNMFRKGWAFVSMTLPAEGVETKRGRFFGTGRGVDHPFMVEKGESDNTQLTDRRQIAAFLGTVEIPANGERTIAFILGETDEKKQATQVVQKYSNTESVRKSLDKTRQWWLGLMETCTIETNQPEFDRYQNWLKYQALAERIWARRGFYQTSGAFGFRDQLQDTVNLLWVDPALARKQILLHASHQFKKGDVYHWFFTLTDGRTAFACRSHASDNPLWLVWGVVEYLRATGDESILDERTSYVASQFPFAKLPKNKQGWGHLYHRSMYLDTVYKHCMRSIDLVFKKRMGKNGLPLIQTGDWNDGLDEIGSEGKGESIWLGFFLYYIMKDMIDIIGKKEGNKVKEHYAERMKALKDSLEATWRNDRYLRAFHDNKREIGVEGSGIWETDALTAAWAVMCGINPEREHVVFHTALRVLERDKVILLGWPALREDSTPYLGRSSKYPEGVRENGMYCHGVQWLIRASRILAERYEKEGDSLKADEYRRIAYRLWLKITPISHVEGDEIEIYGGQPNKQPADILTTFDRGRMIWNGYTGAAGWLFRQSLESVIGASLDKNELILPDDLSKARGQLKVKRVERDITKSPIGK